jgi:hypothetical protein
VQWGEAGKRAFKRSSCTYTCQTYATHLLEDGMDIITLKDLWDINIELSNPIFMWFYLPIVLIFGNASTQNSLHTLFETTWKRCNNLAKPKKFRQEDSGYTLGDSIEFASALVLHCS